MLYTQVLMSAILLYLAAGQHSTHGNITWSPCQEKTLLPLLCGSLTVPLDYVNASSNVSMQLSIVKLEASKQPKHGTIVLNPGGPGVGGREQLAGPDAVGLQISTGGVFDLIAFDPRGTGDTIPFSCFTNASTRANYLLKAPSYLNSSDTALGAIRATGTLLGNACELNAKDTASLIGTGYVARDIIRIVDALKEGGLLNYWGFSYGSALGMTVAAMFPNRMGRVVLDGIVNPLDYFSGRDVSLITATDVSFDGFFTGCVANPENCALAQLTLNAQELSEMVYNLIYYLKFTPFVAGPDAVTDIIDYTVLKKAIEAALSTPSIWSIFASGLHGLLTSNMTEARTILSLTNPPQSPTIFPDNGKEATSGILFSDVPPERINTTAFPLVVEELYTTSRLQGDLYAAFVPSYRDWPFKAKGAYLGDFKAKTKNPILFVGGALDPVTPLPNAYNASAGFEGSVVLEHGGYGHTSPADPSLCTARAIRAYFVNGTLPASGTKCKPLFGLFSNNTREEALALLDAS